MKRFAAIFFIILIACSSCSMFKSKDLKSAKEQFMQMINEWSHLKRIGPYVAPPRESGSDLKISISRKGVKAFYPSALQYSAGKSR